MMLCKRVPCHSPSLRARCAGSAKDAVDQIAGSRASCAQAGAQGFGSDSCWTLWLGTWQLESAACRTPGRFWHVVRGLVEFQSKGGQLGAAGAPPPVVAGIASWMIQFKVKRQQHTDCDMRLLITIPRKRKTPHQRRHVKLTPTPTQNPPRRQARQLSAPARLQRSSHPACGRRLPSRAV